MIRRSPISLAVAMIALSAPVGMAAASEPAVKGFTPANPTMVLSIPSPNEIHGALSASPFGQAVLAAMADAIKPAPGTATEQRAALEQSLGISFDIKSLMTETLTGADLYLVEPTAVPAFVINLQFSDSAMPGKILDQVKRDATGATGVSAGISADTVVESAANNARTLYLPAFEIFLGARGNVLVWSTNRGSLESAFADEGKAIFQSDFMQRTMSQLKPEKAHIWGFGEADDLAMILASRSSAAAQGASNSSATGGFTITFEKSRTLVESFKHQDDMPPSLRRYAMTAPPADDINIINYLPESSVMAYANNHFDALAMLEVMEEGLTAGSEPMLKPGELDERLKASRALLGFDPKDDLLANLGPGAGFALTKMETTSSAPLPQIDGVLAVQIKNREKFLNVLKVLDQMATQAAASAAPPPRPAPATTATAEGQAATPAPSPSPRPTPSLQKETIDGAEVTYIQIEGSPLGNLSPAWGLTSDGIFLFSMSRETLAATVALSRGNGRTILQSSALKEANEPLPGNRNQYFALRLDTMGAMVESLRGFIPENRAAEVERGMAILRACKAMTGTTTYTQNGERQTIVLTY